MSNVAVKAELVSSIFILVQTEADMPRTKAALSDALRIGAEEMTSQITSGTIAPVVEARPTTKAPRRTETARRRLRSARDRDTKLRELAAEVAPAKGKKRSSAQAKKMKQVVLRELKNGTPADRLASLFNTRSATLTKCVIAKGVDPLQLALCYMFCPSVNRLVMGADEMCTRVESEIKVSAGGLRRAAHCFSNTMSL